MQITRESIGFTPETADFCEKKERLLVQTEAALPNKVEGAVVSVAPEWTYQQIKGFGCALTGTSCLLLSKMDAKERRAALGCWFGEAGIRARYIRMSIYSCDYSPYTYQAVPDPISDPTLETFSIREDQKFILPVVKEALSLAGHACEVMLSPWSPPWQWKTPPETHGNDAAAYGNQQADALAVPSRIGGGRLKREFYGAWAAYVVRYIQAYLAEGIPVTMLSVQNEADAATSWDSCLWSAEEERIFVRDYLHPALRRAQLDKQIGLFIWDHNKERMAERALATLQPDTLPLVQGVAYHWYTGDHFDALTMVHERFPDITLLHSESCPLHKPYGVHGDMPCRAPTVAEKAVDYQDAIRYAHDLLGDINHGMHGWIDWNLIVDRLGGPRHIKGGFAAPLLYEQDGHFTKTLMYRYIRLIAGNIPAGSVRLGVSCYTSAVDVAALRRPDGKIVLFLHNPTAQAMPLTLRLAGAVCDLSAQRHSLSAVLIDL